MRVVFNFLFLFLITPHCKAQAISNFCSFYDEKAPPNINLVTNVYTNNINSDAYRATKWILEKSNIQKDFYVISLPNINNCFALFYKGKRYIVIDENFVQGIVNNTRTNNSATFIISHEIAHHLLGHTLDNKGSRPSTELQADSLAGYLCAKLGVPELTISAALLNLKVSEGSFTHPPQEQRVAATMNGFVVSLHDYYLKNAKNKNDSLSAFYYIQAATANSNELKIKNYTRCIQIKKFAPAYLERAQIKDIMNDYFGALRDLDSAIQINKDYYTAYNNRGNIKCKLGKFKNAIDDFTHAINLNPNPSLDYCNRGITYVDLKKYKKAFHDFRISLNLNPSNIDAYIARGKLSFTLMRYLDAYNDFKIATEIQPTNEYVQKWKIAAYQNIR